MIVDVPLAERSYRIHLHGGLLGDPMHAAWRSVPAPSVALVVSDTNVWPLYGERLLACLGALGTTAHSIVLPAGEATKSLAHLSSVWDAALQLGADRDLCVVALGGGVVGDIAGFAAASVLRGVRFWQVPTSLLAMVDSSVGGKTGINHATGKNLLGAFYQPDVVLADLDTLSTLPPREVSAGLAEAVKHGVVLDAALVARMESSAEALVGLNPTAIAPVVARCCALKAEVVAADEREAGLRKVLNFGHTIGHALERVLGYGALLHGEAVSVGMVAAAFVAESELGADPAIRPRLVTLLQRLNLPVRWPSGALPGEVADAIVHDKKRAGSAVTFVLAPRLGQHAWQPVPLDHLQALLEEVADALGDP